MALLDVWVTESAIKPKSIWNYRVMILYKNAESTRHWVHLFSPVPRGTRVRPSTEKNLPPRSSNYGRLEPSLQWAQITPDHISPNFNEPMVSLSSLFLAKLPLSAYPILLGKLSFFISKQRCQILSGRIKKMLWTRKIRWNYNFDVRSSIIGLIVNTGGLRKKIK